MIPIKYTDPTVSRHFIEAHPFRIDLPNDQHVRYQDFYCACRSAAFLRQSLWDERNQRGMSFAECVQIVNSIDNKRRVA